jgi:hypothetical protein
MTLELGAWWKKLDVMTKKRATLGKRRLDRLGLAAHWVVECSLPEEKETSRQLDGKELFVHVQVVALGRLCVCW